MDMPLYMLEDVELRVAGFKSYNDWSAENCGHDAKRLLTRGLITFEDIQAGAKELARCARKAIRGGTIWALAPYDKPYGGTTMSYSVQPRPTLICRFPCAF